MTVSDIRFEDLSIRDARSISYSFEVLSDQLFSKGLLKARFSGEEVWKTKKNPRMKELIEDILDENRLNHKLFWEMSFMPFINGLSKD